MCPPSAQAVGSATSTESASARCVGMTPTCRRANVKPSETDRRAVHHPYCNPGCRPGDHFFTGGESDHFHSRRLNPECGGHTNPSGAITTVWGAGDGSYDLQAAPPIPTRAKLGLQNWE